MNTWEYYVMMLVQGMDVNTLNELGLNRWELVRDKTELVYGLE